MNKRLSALRAALRKTKMPRRDLKDAADDEADEKGYLLLYAGGFAKLGGIEAFLFDLGIAMTESGFRVVLCCWDGASPNWSDRLRRLDRSGVRVIRLPWRWGCRFGLPDRMLAAVAARTVSNAAVVVFGKQPSEREYCKLLSCSERGARPPFVLVTPYRPSEMWRCQQPSAELLNTYTTIIVQSEAFAEDVRAHGYSGRVDVIPYLPPVVTSCMALPPCDELRLGFLGRLAPEKNLGYLLEAFVSLQARVQASLHIFGDGRDGSSLVKTALSLGVRDKVVFHGTVTGINVADAIDSCHMFAFTSTTEGQCLAALEILARGRPIIATPVGVFPELLTEGTFGLLAPASDSNAYAEAVIRVFRDIRRGHTTPSRLQAQFSQRFSRSEVVRSYAALFRNLERNGSRDAYDVAEGHRSV